MSNAIDTSDIKFFDAPLKTLPENKLRQINAEMVGNSGVGFGAVNPHLYNKTCMLECSGITGNALINGGTVIDYNDTDAEYIQSSKMTVCGLTSYLTNPASHFENPHIDDYAIFVELAPLSEYNSEGYYDNAELIGTGYKNKNSSRTDPFYNDFDMMGLFNVGIVNRDSNLAPLPTNEYDNWLYVKQFKVYNRAEGDTNSRVNKVSYPSESWNIMPLIIFDCQNLYYYRYKNGYPDANVFNANFQSVILANFLNRIDAPLWQLGNWRMFNVQKSSDNAVWDVISSVVHTSDLGDNIKLLKPHYSDTNLQLWISSGAFGQPEFIFRETGTRANYSVLAFKSFDDFKWLLADWGLVKVTDDINVAERMPSELFPGYVPPDGGGNPDGGDNTGYDDNNPVTDIPSYKDNTSDSVTPVTPNISSINAASVYALTITSVKTLLSWLMTEGFTKNISELFSDKLSALDDLKILPIDIVNHDPLHTEASASLTLANVTNDNLPCHKILPNYNCIVNGGDYHYTAYWGNYNDYTASSYYLYIPYGGIVELSPSHVVNRDLHIDYALDIMTGNATAIVYSNGVLVKTVPCQMGQTIPITYTNTNQRQIRNALTALNAGTSIINMAAGRQDVLSGVLDIGTSVATTAMTNPLRIGSIGNFSSGTSMIMPQNPFLIISRIQQAIPANRQSVMGIPSNINTKISNFVDSGFVQIRASHINTSATTAEQQQIIGLLSSGIFI